MIIHDKTRREGKNDNAHSKVLFQHSHGETDEIQLVLETDQVTFKMQTW
jgi:hypothetical protein